MLRKSNTSHCNFALGTSITTSLLLSLLLVALHADGAPKHQRIKRQTAAVNCFYDKQCGNVSWTEDSNSTCCLGQGYSYQSDSGSCNTCVVIGWKNVTTNQTIEAFTAVEAFEAYSFKVDYVKGSGALNLQFRVDAIPNTAESSDFLVSTALVDLGNSVEITLRRDFLSLEEDELFQVNLHHFDGMNEFFLEPLDVTIIDNDVVSVFFAEIDYSLSPEDKQNLTFQIVRSTAIATTLSVIVYPLNNTYVNQTKNASAPPLMFMGEPLYIPDEIIIPDQDLMRPTVATSNEDFDDAPILIEMEPSEQPQQDYSRTVSIMPDKINEAVENFVLIMKVENAVRSESVNITKRNATRCIIRDDDPIFISFEHPLYQFLEPQLDRDFPITIIKSKNSTTEQTLTLYIVRDDPESPLPLATAGNSETSDFTIDVLEQGSSVRTFPATDLIYNLTIHIFKDDIFEGVEVFGFSITNDIGGVEFQFGESDFPSTVITLIDQGNVTIGFERTFTSVKEVIGSFELCVNLSTFISGDLDIQISLNLFSVQDTADAMDYKAINASNKLLGPFTSDPSTHRQCFDVNITNDEILEDNETFSLRLSEVEGSSVPVIIHPAVSTVKIIDDDFIVAGFENTSIIVKEDEGFVEFCVRIFTNATLLSDTKFNFSLDLITTSGSADAMDYVEINNLLALFTSDPSTHRQCFNVTIIDDDAIEIDEDFFLNLTLAGKPTVPVVVNPNTSRVEIMDKAHILVGFEKTMTSVYEDVGQFDLCVTVNETQFLPITFNFSLDLHSVVDTADTKDFEEITNTNNPLIPFNEDLSTHRQCFSVNITDDEALEDIESFSLNLTLVGDSTYAVIVDPAISVVNIMDNDYVLVGFKRTFIAVFEDVGLVEYCVRIFTDTALLPTYTNMSFTLDLLSIPDTADASDYIEFDASDYITGSSTYPHMYFTSDISTHEQCFNVTIIDDEVVEDMEMFSLNLSLAEGSNVKVVVSPNIFNVTIFDNDEISVGFERTFITVQEDDGSVELCVRIFTNTSLLEKDNIDFILTLISVANTADATDFVEIKSTNSPLDRFTSDPSTHRQCFNVTILNDAILEGTENFFLRLSLADGSTNAVVVTKNESVVEITDGYIYVGFEGTFKFVREESGTTELCIRIFNEIASNYKFSFSLDLITISGTADINDYVEIANDSNPLVPFTSDRSTHRQCFNVNVTDDYELEYTENFFLDLFLADNSSVLVVVDPPIFEIAISDGDYVVIGFEQTAVTANETVGVVTLVVSVLNGWTTTPVCIMFATTDNGTATGGLDFIETEQLLQFNESVISHEINVIIINNGTAEPTEYFLVLLTLVKPQRPEKIIIRPDVANVTILDGTPPNRVNDTVIGDPLLTVPVLVTNLEDLGLDKNLSLCFEVRGQSDKYFNLVSDMCTSVSAHYFGVSSFNVIDEIGVKAVDSMGNCRSILISTKDGGTATVDGEIVDRFSEGGISVRRYQHHVRIAIPNCAHVDLVIWIIHQNRTLTEHNDQGEDIKIGATMLRLVIARGFNLQESSHGILGQFWNVRVIAEPYNGTVPESYPNLSSNYYTVTMTHPDSPVRHFSAFYGRRSWEVGRGKHQPCLYAGNYQAGRMDEIPGYNDPVIEGNYTDYIVSGPFTTDFRYSRFQGNRCL